MCLVPHCTLTAPERMGPSILLQGGYSREGAGRRVRVEVGRTGYFSSLYNSCLHLALCKLGSAQCVCGTTGETGGYFLKFPFSLDHYSSISLIFMTQIFFFS